MPLITPICDADLGYGLWPWARGPKWRLEQDYTFVLARDVWWEDAPQLMPIYTIPRGYLFDKASVPPFLWGFPFGYTPDGLCTLPALEHDFLCDLLAGGSSWLAHRLLPNPLPMCPPARVVHEHFEKRLFEVGVRPSKAKAMGLAVKLLGPGGKLRWRKLP